MKKYQFSYDFLNYLKDKAKYLNLRHMLHQPSTTGSISFPWKERIKGGMWKSMAEWPHRNSKHKKINAII